MSSERFNRAFGGRKAVFLIALHVTPHIAQWEQDVYIAHSEGADGIIVIRDYTTSATNEDVLQVYNYARRRYRDWHVGLNLLGYKPLDAVLKPRTGVSSFWFDQPFVDEDRKNGALYFAEVRSKSDTIHLQKPPLLIPSVAMKGQPQPKSMARVAQLLEPHADIIVTSGNKTGEPPSIEKMRALRSVVRCPIGMASGTSAENVKGYIDIGVNIFIAWSSIAQRLSFHGNVAEALDPPKVGALRAAIPRH